MNYKDINDKWKSFLFENTFKEDKLIDTDKAKKKKKRKPEKKNKEDGKEIITNEYEEFENEAVINEPSGSETNKAVDSVEEEEQLEEMSSMSGGAVQGYAGSFMSKKAFKRKWA